MPSKSPAQHRLMEAVAHNPQFAKKAGIPQSVGKDFAAADSQKPANPAKVAATVSALRKKKAPMPGAF